MDSHVGTPGMLLVVGDFNIHVDDKANSDGLRLNDLLYSMNLQQHISAPTHERGHTLDLLITREAENLVSELTVHAPSLSDHCPITCSLKIKKVEN